MGKMAADHGSELHLLRFMGRHRQALERAIKETVAQDARIRVDTVEWLDFPFSEKKAPWDSEWKSVDFLPDHGGRSWLDFWPDSAPGKSDRNGMPSWDAVGRLHTEQGLEWLLVEAKAHVTELAPAGAACRAGGKSFCRIESSLRQTYEAFTPTDRRPWEDVKNAWLGNYYQKANRLACLHFLNSEGLTARLLYIYFVGDSFSDAPPDREGWEDAINKLYMALGLPRHGLERLHEVFLNVKDGCLL